MAVRPRSAERICYSADAPLQWVRGVGAVHSLNKISSRNRLRRRKITAESVPSIGWKTFAYSLSSELLRGCFASDTRAAASVYKFARRLRIGLASLLIEWIRRDCSRMSAVLAASQ